VSLRAIAIDLAGGRIIHDIELFYHRDPEPVHSLNSYASPTPILHQGRLHCHFGNMGTACVETRTGEVAWKARLPQQHSVGPGSARALFGKLLIIRCDGTEAQNVIALDAASGDQAWKPPRPAMTGELAEMHKAFSTPLVFNDGKRDQVVV